MQYVELADTICQHMHDEVGYIPHRGILLYVNLPRNSIQTSNIISSVYVCDYCRVQVLGVTKPPACANTAMQPNHVAHRTRYRDAAAATNNNTELGKRRGAAEHI